MPKNNSANTPQTPPSPSDTSSFSLNYPSSSSFSTNNTNTSTLDSNPSDTSNNQLNNLNSGNNARGDDGNDNSNNGDNSLTDRNADKPSNSQPNDIDTQKEFLNKFLGADTTLADLTKAQLQDLSSKLEQSNSQEPNPDVEEVKNALDPYIKAYNAYCDELYAIWKLDKMIDTYDKFLDQELSKSTSKKSIKTTKMKLLDSFQKILKNHLHDASSIISTNENAWEVNVEKDKKNWEESSCKICKDALKLYVDKEDKANQVDKNRSSLSKKINDLKAGKENAQQKLVSAINDWKQKQKQNENKNKNSGSESSQLPS